jgi:hypothetical protein
MKQLLLLLVLALIVGSSALAPTSAQDDAETQTCPDATVDFHYYQDDESQGVTNVDFVWAPGVDSAVWYRLRVYSTVTWNQVLEKAYQGDMGALVPVSDFDKGVMGTQPFTEGDYAFILTAEDADGNALCFDVGTFTITRVYRPPAPVVEPPAKEGGEEGEGEKETSCTNPSSYSNATDCSAAGCNWFDIQTPVCSAEPYMHYFDLPLAQSGPGDAIPELPSYYCPSAYPNYVCYVGYVVCSDGSSIGTVRTPGVGSNYISCTP